MNQKEVINRTSSLLLKGWKMLAISCPICKTALMSKNDQMRCPGCDMPVLTEGQQPNHSSNQLISHDTNDATNHFGALESKEVERKEAEKILAEELPIEQSILEGIEEPTSFEEMKKEYDERNKRTNVVSTKLGEKMLQGWTMLADSCPNFDYCGGTPLMKDPATGSLVCVSCTKEYIYNSYGEIVKKDSVPVPGAAVVEAKEEEGETKKKVVVAVKHPAVEDLKLDEFDNELDDPPRIVNFQSREENDSSWKISQKLLLGWALMDASCYRCNGRTPLLKDLKGKRYCVECGFIDEPIKTVVTAVAPSSKTKALQQKLEEDDEEDAEEVERKIQNLLQKSFMKSKVAAVTFSNQNGESLKETSVLAVKADVSEILVKKLRSSAQDLDESDSIETSIKYAELITRLAESLKAVQNL